MAVSNLRKNVAYGLSDALLNTPSLPIISERAPSANDKAPLGTIWVDRPNNDGYILTSIVANSATWIGIGGGPGVFTNLEVSGTADVAGEASFDSNVTLTAGNLILSAGDIDVVAGEISADQNIVSLNGNLAATVGIVVGGSGVSAVTGDITADAGDVIATLGNIEALAGDVVAQSIFAAGDSGGTALTTGFTNVVDNTQGVGTMTILSSTANPGNNAGFLKIYVGATTAYVPYFTDIAP